MGLVLSLTEQAAPTNGTAVAVNGALKDYDWGMIDGLRPWVQDASQNPQAELWFGYHPNGESLIAGSGRPLSELTEGRAPLMMKLIACARPLSIQVHPDEATAQGGLPGFVTDKQTPVLVDSHGKDEMLLALSRFDLLAGFLTPEAGYQVLHDFGGAFDAAAEAYASGDVAGAVRKVMQMPVS
jgi:mannose-6-phosphate isomerase